MERKLYKSRTGAKIDGVCQGFANYFSMDVTLIRLVWILGVFMGGAGVWFYIICAVLMPREPFVEIFDEHENRQQ